jgi:N-acetylneuraminate synthase
MSRCFVVAEAGVNHNGSLDLALRLLEAAKRAGANAVKFQTFRADALASRAAPKATYQIETTGANQSQWEMLKRLELDDGAHRALRARAERSQIEFMSAPFDEAALEYLVALGVRRLKLPSGELTNGPLLLRAARTGLPLIVSTGMATLAEVDAAMGVLAFGVSAPAGAIPSRAAFAAALADPVASVVLRERVTLLHCTTQYPAPPESANLRAMETLRRRFGVAVGYSDHTDGIAISVAAAALGASVIEKHLTLDRNMPGPDHRASLDPESFAAMVAGIRQAEAALGDGVKAPHVSEVANIAVARKSLVAARAIPAGKPIEPADLIAKRPGDGTSPMEYWGMMGWISPRHYVEDEKL